jgi:eukaryotic-like serine/threonine-protein kinase
MLPAGRRSELICADALGPKYAIEHVLGSGGMGVVVAAKHRLLDRDVAIKLVLPEAVNREHLSARLLHEARAAARLQGKHVVRVLDVDMLADGTACLVMERLVGRTLRSLLDEQQRLAWQDVVEYALEACDALAEAHDAGIVHRDIKPANLYLARRPGTRATLRLIDFGACRTQDTAADAGPFLPNDTGFVGSPSYVSPEQLVSPGDVDGRADLWSLGIALYECLAGTVPFRDPSPSRLWQRILLDAIPSLDRELRVPVELERVVRRCLMRSADARYPSARALARDLGELRASSPRSSLVQCERLVADHDTALTLSRRSNLALDLDASTTLVETGAP